MASSQVEVASSSSSSSPFGCVLRDHSRRDHRWTNTDSNINANVNANANANAAFQKNFNDFVHSISGQPRNAAASSDSNHNIPINPADLWVHIPTYTLNVNENENDDHSRNNDANDAAAAPDEKWDTPEEMEFPPGADADADAITQHRGSSAPVTPLRRENSPFRSENSVDIPNLGGGVSSLVQKWRDFEAEAKTSTSTANNTTSAISPVCTTRSNSGSIFPENASTEISRRASDAGDHESIDVKYETRSMHEDSFGDWDSDRTGISCPPSSQGRDPDAAEKERLRVADIVRKLTSTNEDNNNNDRDHGVGNESLPRVRTSADQSTEQRSFSPVMGSPRLRGRQAFGDLLMQMERDRHRELEGLEERKPVSKFSQRGRIQAMLRVQFLRRGQLNCTSSQSKRLTQSAIMHLRERFKPMSQPVAVESKIPHKGVVDNPLSEVKMSSSSHETRKDNHREEVTAFTCPHTQVADNIQHAETSCLSKSNIVDVDICHLEMKTTLEKSSLQAPSSEHVYEDAIQKLDVPQQRAVEEIRNCGLLESAERATPFDDIEQNSDGQKLIEIRSIRPSCNANLQCDQQLTETIPNSASNYSHSPCHWEEEGANNQYLSESEHGWVSDVSHTQVGWEELHSDYERQIDTGDDWIYDISRPRSEWEDLRQARYQEMLDPLLEKEEICQLLHRKSVSSFLSSGLRESIDKLMISRTQHQPNPARSQTAKEQKQVTGEEVERAQGYEREQEEEEVGNAGYDDDYDEDEEVESRIESVEYADQTEPSPPSTSWNHNHGPEASDDSQVASSSLQQNTSPESCCLKSRPCYSVTKNSSIEMELIYELRGHMLQLHQEMSELRNTIKSCMNMQLKLEQSVKREIASALGHSGQRRGRHSAQKKGPSKGICCICCEVQVDSLLYRCGHMCTCFKCAHELQWSSKSCPVCQAPIIDIVRPYGHS